MSNAELWSNLITGTFALGGALLGFVGSWFAAARAAKVTREQIQATREQRQQDRIHERRDEAVSECYAQLLALYEAYRNIVVLSRSDDKDSKREEINHLLSDIMDWLQYFRKNQPWIPEVVANKMIHLAHAYQKRALDFRESLVEASEAKLPEALEDEYRRLEDLKETSGFEWLRFEIRAALGIEESDIDHGHALRDRSRNSE